jgi:hypothetical protein
MLFQYRSFSFAASQKIMLRGMQESPAALVHGLVGMTMVGMLVSQLKALRQGHEGYERWRKQSENLGFWIGEGMDNSGVMTPMFEVANSVEKATKVAGGSFNPIKSPLAMLGGGDASVDSTRTFNQDFWRQMFGPAYGMPNDIAKAAGGAARKISGEEPTMGQARSATRILPFNTMFPIKEALQLAIGDSPYRR